MADATRLLDGFTFTEGLRWHDGRVWFSDLYNRRVHSCLEDGSDLRLEAQFDAIPVGLAWLPDGRLLVVLQDIQQIVRREHDGSFVVHADLAGVGKGWGNDIVTTADGTAYAGYFGFDLYTAEEVQPARLAKIRPDGTVTATGSASWFANGCQVVDSGIVVAESLGNRISHYSIDAAGELTDRRDWATFGPLPESTDLATRLGQVAVAPDGISVPDAEGAIWVADFVRPTAHRVMPGGRIVDSVSTGDLNCICAALGGHDGRTLFLSAAPSELDPVIRRNDPQAAIMTYRVEVPLA